MSVGLFEKSVEISQTTGQRHSCKKKKKKSGKKSNHRHEKLHTVYKEREREQRFWRIHLRRGLVGIETRELGRSQRFSFFLWKACLRGSY